VDFEGLLAGFTEEKKMKRKKSEKEREMSSKQEYMLS